MGKCEKCGKDISEKVEGYSKANYGKPLCFDCQKLPEMKALADAKMQERTKEGEVEEESPDEIMLHGKKFITHVGLLHKAHNTGIISIDTKMLSEIGKEPVLFRAEVIMQVKDSTTQKKFVAHGDASKENVGMDGNKSMLQHIIRLAETRAINRALRLSTDTGTCSAEELGEKEEDEQVPSQESKPVLG